MVRGGVVEIEDLLTQRSFGGRRRLGPFFVFDGNAESLPECFDRFGEIELFGLTDERNDVTRLAAAEAFVEAFVGINMEGGRLFVVEGAQALEPRATALAQRHNS